jgi:hypothetical protein
MIAEGGQTVSVHLLGNREDEQGDVILPVGPIEIRQSVEDFILDFGGS